METPKHLPSFARVGVPLLGLCTLIAGCGTSHRSLVKQTTEPISVVSEPVTVSPTAAAPQAAAAATSTAAPLDPSPTLSTDKVLEGAFASIAKGGVADITTLAPQSSAAPVPVAAPTTQPVAAATALSAPAGVTVAMGETQHPASINSPSAPAAHLETVSAVDASTAIQPAQRAGSNSEMDVAEAWQRAVAQQATAAVAAQVNPHDYHIQPEDLLDVAVYEEPDLAVKGARVTSAGEIMFPLLGRVVVAGLTVDQVQEKLIKMLAEDYLVNPQVQVSIQTYHAGYIFVTGAVSKPGSYPIPTERRTTLMEAIAMAGGFSDRASSNSTRIVRLEGGEKRTITVRANDIVKRGDKNQDVTVYPNDIVFVPESFL